MSTEMENYSLIATLSYFTVYALIYLIVSIICAVKISIVHETELTVPAELEEQVSVVNETKLITTWMKLLWQKRNIYLQLIPHFLDQATDIGVIIEYYRLYNEGDDIGINTWYLLSISIAIIIIHKFISSLAIYRLTRTLRYIIYQLFDLSLIPCIWTNYEIDTNEQTNAQRYLQVLEATFQVRYILIVDIHRTPN